MGARRNGVTAARGITRDGKRKGEQKQRTQDVNRFEMEWSTNKKVKAEKKKEENQALCINKLLCMGFFPS